MRSCAVSIITITIAITDEAIALSCVKLLTLRLVLWQRGRHTVPMMEALSTDPIIASIS